MIIRRILFICEHNSVHSQIAEGYLRSRYGDRYEVYSAGIEPKKVHPMAIEVMDEIGIDISGHHSKEIFEFLDKNIDVAVLLSPRAAFICPKFPGANNTFQQEFSYPVSGNVADEQVRKNFQKLRDEISRWIDENVENGGIFT